MDGQTSPLPFRIMDCALAAVGTGVRAHNLRELRDNILTIHAGSIYYHFWGGLLRPRFDDREFNNDFAIWSHVSHGLHDDALAERLAVIDPTDYEDLEALRYEIAEIMSERLDESEKLRLLHADRPFQFNRSQIVIFDTGLAIDEPEQLAETAPRLSPSSYFFHVIDARRRTPGTDDFRAWLSSFDGKYADLIRVLDEVDPYFVSLADLRWNMSRVFREYFGGGS